MGDAPPDDFIERIGRFFMDDSPVHHAMFRIITILEELEIPYALAGAMALNAHGYRRETTDVDLLVTSEGLAKFKATELGRGYVEKRPGGRPVRDTINNVPIDFLIAGDFPGDGKPKAIAFPSPSVAIRKQSGTMQVAIIPLEKLIELKLASGLSAAHRGKDLVDVQEAIKHIALPRDFADKLDPSVQAKFGELWELAQIFDPISD